MTERELMNVDLSMLCILSAATFMTDLVQDNLEDNSENFKDTLSKYLKRLIEIFEAARKMERHNGNSNIVDFSYISLKKKIIPTLYFVRK